MRTERFNIRYAAWAWLLCLLTVGCQQDELMQQMPQKHTATSGSGVASRSVTCEVTSEAGALMTKLDEMATNGGYAKEDITELTIKGTVNREDLRSLRPFAKMTKLDMTSMTIVDDNGNTTTELPDHSLDSLQSPAHIYLPTGLSVVRSYAFYDSKIVAVEMGDNIHMLDSYSFEQCKNLHTVQLSNNIDEMGYGVFKNCTSLVNINIPEKLKGIRGDTFNGCAFSSITIPEAVEYIDWSAFSNNPNLETVSNWPEKVTEIPSNCFYNCPQLKFEIPSHITTIGSSAFERCTMSSLTIPETVERIYSWAFAVNPNLTNINWPSKVTTIPSYCFYQCTNLKFGIPNTVTSIENQAFGSCESLTTDLVIPSSVVQLSERAFYGCKSITSVTIPNTLTDIKIYVFQGCTNLQTVNGISHWTKIPDGTFADCSSLNLEIPAQVDSIGSSAFYRCTSILNPQLPATLKYIGSQAFQACEQITEINIPDGVEYIGRYAFNNTSIKELTIPSTVQTVEDYIVSDCDYLKVIYWNTAADMPELFYSWNNYGTLIYAKAGINYNANNKNLILGDDENGYTTESFEIVDDKDFFCPKAFTAKQVVFRKHFGAWTEPDKAGGWRTIALPFTVTKFVAQANGDQPERTLKPFGSEDMGDAKPFWLRTLHSDGFGRETTLEGGKPYIIAFPYNPNYYLPEYNIWGTIEFWGENVTVLAHTQTTPIEGPDYTFYPTFEKLKKSLDIYNIDYDGYNDRMHNIYYEGGSLFRSSIRDTEAFESYIMNNATGRSVIAIDNQPKSRSTLTLGPVPMEDDM